MFSATIPTTCRTQSITRRLIAVMSDSPHVNNASYGSPMFDSQVEHRPAVQARIGLIDREIDRLTGATINRMLPTLD